ncbi:MULTISPECIES: HNH endonuclease family protein [Halorussus]|uniref:HNH endonuclease family protein n=1 Tax=Halorussus TaxID=1070314 RepID=UPI0020A0599E|nr:DUF262 domain-containing protein [Halorussus vallis]USZ77577.1 DUF262 domain-containing protein [Halorussus vallis]
MPSFDPKTKYNLISKEFRIKEFSDYSEEFVARPPYQRKNVWSPQKQKDLLDSIFRRYYIPRIVLREVRLDDDSTVYEVIDGQQRITTAQKFIDNELKLPDTLEDVHEDLPGSTYSELSSDLRRFVDKLVYDADIVQDIDDPRNPEHLRIATEIFWRLQQGETLNYMEVAHSRLSSTARNFVVKYADDQRFNYDAYKPISSNPDKHSFFEVLERDNSRMQHLALLTRFLILEENGRPTDIKETEVKDFIDEHLEEDGISDWSFDDKTEAENVIQTMNIFYDIFKDDPMVSDGSGMQEFKTEYFTISVWLLIRHLNKYYVLDEDTKQAIHDFVVQFHERWKDRDDDDQDIIMFSDNRQQSGGEIEVRDRIIRQAFFEYIQDEEVELTAVDDRRSFNEAERIKIYRQDNGLCQECLNEDKPEKEAEVSWEDYEADHVIPHSKGGNTDIENAQLLCQHHNRVKGNTKI